MSISAINWAFHQKTGSPASKLVLIKLADNANDEGRCYPSLAYIAKHCEMHRSTVIRHISALSKRGLVDIEHRTVEGSKIPNVYHLKIRPLVAECDQGSRTERPGVVAECDQGSRTLRHRTVIEPSVEPSVNRKEAPPTGDGLVLDPPPAKPNPKPTDIDLPDWLDPELWAMWCDERKARRKPVTPRAAKLQIKKLAEYREQGFSPQDVIEHSIASGYQGLFPPRGNENAKQPTSIVERVRANMEQYCREREGATYDGDGNPVDAPF